MSENNSAHILHHHTDLYSNDHVLFSYTKVRISKSFNKKGLVHKLFFSKKKQKKIQMIAFFSYPQYEFFIFFFSTVLSSNLEVIELLSLDFLFASKFYRCNLPLVLTILNNDLCIRSKRS